MSSSNPNLRFATLSWSGRDLIFDGEVPKGSRITIDSGSNEGPSPMELLLLSTAGCMGIDVLLILQKSRVTVDELEVRMEGERAETDPKRFLRIDLSYRLRGPTEDDEGRIQRAIDLSRDKYCSVLHTLNPDIDVTISFERT